MSQNPIYKRWYDRQPRLAQAVRLMSLLPDEIRSIISEGVMLLANREFEIKEEAQSFRSMGSEKIMGLHKSKHKRREYDTNEQLHKAMNYLYILSDENQDFMADHILRMMQYIQSYLSTCQAFQAAPSLEDVAGITNRYVEKGSNEVEKFINQLRQEFYEKMLATQNEDPPLDFLEQITENTASGVKITRSDENKL